MKYSIYVKNRIKRTLISENPKLGGKEAEEEANRLFNEMLMCASYQSALDKLSDDDTLKQKEQEPVLHFYDIRPEAKEYINVKNPYLYLYHGVRFDDKHEHFESILKDEEIRCGNKTDGYYRIGGDNCNEGKYISLIHYTGEDYDIEFKTFVEENVSFVISPLINPAKCVYLPYEEWEKVKSKLPMTKQRYSYARNEYQCEDSISLDYVVGILYPYHFYMHTKGFEKTRQDFRKIKELLIKYGYSSLPIFDPTDNFCDITHLEDDRSMYFNYRSYLIH